MKKVTLISILFMMICGFAVTISQTSSQKEYKYDKLGRLVFVKTTVDGNESVKTYTYDENGNIVGVVIKGIPILTTNSTSNITSSTANSGGNITNDGGASGGVTNRGVCWSTNPLPNVSDPKTSLGNGSNSFSSSITGLSPKTTYYIRAYADNQYGTGYGQVVSFTTTADIPTLSTNEISSITTNSVVCGGNITANGGENVSARGVCWSTSPSPTISNNFTSNGNGNGSFESSVTNLIPNTKYYLRAYATNSIGTAYGDERSFTTLNSNSDKIVKIKQILHGFWSSNVHSPATVSIELRSGTALINSTLVKRLPSFIDSDGYSKVNFKDVQDGNYWLVVRASGHLPIAKPSTISLSSQEIVYDFTTSSDKSEGGTNALVQPTQGDPWMMRAGDFNSSRSVTSEDLNLYFLPSNGKSVNSQIPAGSLKEVIIPTNPTKIVKTKQILHGLWSSNNHLPISVIIELRSGSTLNNSTVEATLPSIIDAAGYSTVDFGSVANGDYWLVVRATGYVPIAKPTTFSLSSQGLEYDFTTGSDKTIGTTNAMFQPGDSGPWMVRSGDLDCSRSVTSADLNLYFLLSNGKSVASSIPAP